MGGAFENLVAPCGTAVLSPTARRRRDRRPFASGRGACQTLPAYWGVGEAFENSVSPRGAAVPVPTARRRQDRRPFASLRGAGLAKRSLPTGEGDWGAFENLVAPCGTAVPGPTARRRRDRRPFASLRGAGEVSGERSKIWSLPVGQRFPSRRRGAVGTGAPSLRGASGPLL